MHSCHPATRWQEAFPSGNGQLGALVYGNIRKDLVVLNHEALWRRSAKPHLPTVNDWRAQGLSMFWGVGDNPPFQIDANFGMTAAMMQMLVFSRPGLIKLLPALPRDWSRGHVEGLCCRGGVNVDLEWDMGADRLGVTFHPQTDRRITLGFPRTPKDLEHEHPECVARSDWGADYITLALPAGRKTQISVRF